MSAGSEPPERVLLTGGRGFVGQHLADALARLRPQWELTICGGPGDQGPSLDVADEQAVTELVYRVHPTITVHLAAVSAVTASIAAPRAAWSVNLGGTLNLVTALLQHSPRCRLLYISSAEVYGRSLMDGRPAEETTLLEPTNPYAASKAAADILVRQSAADGLFTTIARPFNHTGPGQSEAFAAPAFAAQIARIEAGLQLPMIRVGDLDAERDFLDVSDVVAAYLALMEAADIVEPGEVFNIASGQALRIGDLLEILLGAARTKIQVETDPARVRHSPIRRVVGDAGKLKARLGWAPQRPFRQTLLSLLEEQRRRIATEQ